MIVSNHNKYDGDGGGGVAANSPDNECCFGKKNFSQRRTKWNFSFLFSLL